MAPETSQQDGRPDCSFFYFVPFSSSVKFLVQGHLANKNFFSLTTYGFCQCFVLCFLSQTLRYLTWQVGSVNDENASIFFYQDLSFYCDFFGQSEKVSTQKMPCSKKKKVVVGERKIFGGRDIK